MSSVFSDAELTARIVTLKAQLVAVDAAVTAILSGASEYSLDTGQTVQRVKKTSLKELAAFRSALMAELQQVNEMLNGGGSAYYRPSW